MDSFEWIKELLKADRCIRRFNASRPIGHDILLQLVELTRYCSSGRNLQPLRYRLVNDAEECSKVFPNLGWAGYLPQWPGPDISERPTAYLIQCLDTELTHNCMCDDGLQLQAITLGARALGIGGCIIKAFNAKHLAQALAIPEQYELRYVLALGYPHETVKIEDFHGDIKYYRTSDGVHHVPKRQLNDLIIYK